MSVIWRALVAGILLAAVLQTSGFLKRGPRSRSAYFLRDGHRRDEVRGDVLTHRHLGVHNRVLYANQGPERVLETSEELWVLPNSPVELGQVVTFLHSWAADAVSKGDAVQSQDTVDGAQFEFSSSSSSYLRISASTSVRSDPSPSQEVDDGCEVTGSSAETVRIHAHTYVPLEEQTQLGGLVKMVSRSLIDSLCHDIASTLVDPQPANAAGGDESDQIEANEWKQHPHAPPASYLADPPSATASPAQATPNTDTAVSGSGGPRIMEIAEEDHDLIDFEALSAQAKEFPSSLADLMKLAAADAGESDKTLATDEKSMEEDVRRQAAALQRDRMPQEEEEESPEVIEIEEIEQIEPIKEVEVEESTEERDVVYSWPRAAKSQENLLRTHVRSWADQAFAGRGAGIEATDSADGVKLTFAIVSEDACAFRVRVGWQAGGVLCVRAALENSDGEDARVRDLDSSVRTMVEAASANILKNLKKDLLALVVVLEAGGGDVVANNQQEEVVVVAGEEDLSAGSAPMQALNRANKAATRGGDIRSLLKAQQQQQLAEEGGSDEESTIASKNGYNRVERALRGAPYQADAEEMISPGVLGKAKVVPNLSTPLQKEGRKREPAVLDKAAALGVNLGKFEGRGLEEQAVQELQNMVDRSRKEGFLAVLTKADTATSPTGSTDTTSTPTDTTANTGATNTVDGTAPMSSLMTEGAAISELSWQELLQRPSNWAEDLSEGPTKFPINLEAAGLKGGGLDLFEGPDMLSATGDNVRAPLSSVEGQQAEARRIAEAPSPTTLEADRNSLMLLVNEMKARPAEMHGDILAAYKDVLLCDNLLFLLREANVREMDYGTRLLYRKVTDAAQSATTELGALVKTESVRHLQTIHDVCEVAATYQQNEGQFLDRMEELRPLFDTTLLGFLNYAMQEEEMRIAAAGGDAQRLPSPWIQVLRVVQQGVLAEFERRFDRLLEPLLLVVRFKDPATRNAVLQRFVAITAPADLPYMRELALNMCRGVLKAEENAAAPGGAALPDPSLPDLIRNVLLDVETHLSEEIVAERLCAFEEEAAAQGKEVVVRKRNPLVQARLDEQEQEAAEAGGSDGGGLSESILKRKALATITADTVGTGGIDSSIGGDVSELPWEGEMERFG